MEEELVVVLSTSIVHPTNFNIPNRVKKIHLTPWDLTRLGNGYIQRGLFFPKPDGLEIDVIVSNLKTSLSIALDHFYPLAGRLVRQVNESDHTVSFFIGCDDGLGVKFVHAAAKTITVSDMIKSGFVDGCFGSFFPSTGIKNYHGVSTPLLLVQVTEMKDAIFISYGNNHTVADGKSIWNFLKKWSEICSMGSGSMDIGSGSMEDISCSLRGWFLDGIEYPIHIQDFETKPPSFGSSNMLQEIVFHLTKENVLKLKAKAKGQAKGEEVSSFQAVLGHIWHSRVKNSGMSREEETYCRVPIDMRQRLNPKLKEDCFGNVVQTGLATVNVGELLDHGVGWLAMQINKMVRSQTDENAKTIAGNWVKKVEIRVPVSGGLIVTGSPRFNVYVNDFGWGKPIALRSGPPFVDGKLMNFQGIEDGGIEFHACFTSQVVAKLIKDAEFLEYVDIAS